MNSPIQIFVGTDRSQLLAVKVLEYSIRRHTNADVRLTPMLDLPVPAPQDPRNAQRTGFSFSRFCIPKLMEYKGRAIYMDADMMVFKDIRSLWGIPFDGAKIIVQEEVKHTGTSTSKIGAPKSRKKQSAVMLLDCESLDWKVEDIVAGLDADRYDYDQLMSEFCILGEDEVKYGVPFEWNSLEYWGPETCLLHFTDMATQPWVSPFNPLGHIWFAEVRRMLKDGALTLDEVREEVRRGYFRPSLIADIRHRHRLPKFLLKLWDTKNAFFDKASGYQPHKEVYAQSRARKQAVKQYEKTLKSEQPRHEAA